ncbi:MAG: hypothetical protein LBG22_08290 [Treponema sp.]|nr:hypothetical protein [Treponema sp.]
MLRKQTHKISVKSIAGKQDIKNNIFVMMRKCGVNHIGRHYAEIAFVYCNGIFVVNVNTAPLYYIENFNERMVMKKRGRVSQMPDNCYRNILPRKTVVAVKYLLYLAWGAGREFLFIIPFYHLIPAVRWFRVQFGVSPVYPPVDLFFPGEGQKGFKQFLVLFSHFSRR